MVERPALVRYRPFCQVNSGPDCEGSLCVKALRALTGHKGEELLYREMYVPVRNGSVFDALMCSRMCVGDIIS